MKTRKYILGALAAIAATAMLGGCHTRSTQPTTSRLANLGIDVDSLALPTSFNFDDNGEALPKKLLSPEQYTALGLERWMSIDTAYCNPWLWGSRSLPDGHLLLMGQLERSDNRPSFIVCADAAGSLLDLTWLGECSGVNLSYWDEVSENLLRKGCDTLRVEVVGDTALAVHKWITFYETDANESYHRNFGRIDHHYMLTVDDKGHFVGHDTTSTVTGDTALISPAWIDQRQQEIAKREF